MRGHSWLAMVLLVLVLAALSAPASAAVFQYTVPVTVEKGQSSAFLWIPPEAKQVRGVVMAGMTLMEREFVKDATIRKACAEQQLAIVFLKCGLSATDLQKVLENLAEVSGYKELAVAPLMFVGHSAGGPQAHDMAVKYADRCFGLVQYRGGGPFNGTAIADGIPTLMMVGEFDEFGGTMRNAEGREAWEGSRDRLSEYRAADEARVSSIIIEPGAGHFAWSERNAEYLAMWIRKAAAARIPKTWDIGAAKPVALIAVDAKSGWLTDPTIKTAGPNEPADYADYKGEKGKANWHFDKEMAQATVAYHKGIGKKDQFVDWADSYWVDAGVRAFFNNIDWVGDGQTFQVHPYYRNDYPPTPKGPGPRWADAGKPVGHAKVEIRVKQVSGGVVPVSKDTLRIAYDNLAPATEGGRITFMCYSVGDEEYRHTERVGMMPRGFSGLKDGKDQTITFPEIGTLKANAGPVELKATSDAGLKVEYYVASGPATIEDGKLKIAELPARATFPIEVKIVAWQFGSGVAPKVKTATPVTQTVRIEKP